MSRATVLPLTLPLVRHPGARQTLYPHQAVMLDEWEKRDSFLLVSKTGTGKTIGSLLPILKHGKRAICVYPTNELIGDQLRNIKTIAEREGLTVCIQTLDTTPQEYSVADVVLVHIDANSLDKWCSRKHYSAKWRVLRDLLEGDKPKIVLTNPDILFLIFALRYRAEPLAALSGYDALIFDEFHLYSGVELAHALYMLHLGRSLGAFRKIVLLSATPPPDVREYVGCLLGEPFVADTAATCKHEIVAQREAVQEIQIVGRLAGPDIVETALGIISDLDHDIRERRRSTPADDYVPAVVVVDSVVNAIRLEDRLVEGGFQREDLAIIRGLSAREVRDTGGKLVVIGTSAIEVGIDFRCDYLIFEASEASSFLQRFGRAGRHGPGIVYVLCKSNVLKGLEALPSKIERQELEARVYDWYPVHQTRAWFAKSFAGLLSAFTLTENLLQRVRNDWNMLPEQVASIQSRIDQTAASYAQLLGCDSSLFGRVNSHIQRMRRGDKDYQWIAAYRDLSTFRTSLPSEWVLDFAEKQRRGNWNAAKYSVDVATLLRRAEGLRFKEKIANPDGGQGMLTVKGYGRYKRVWVNRTFADEECGTIYRVGELEDRLLFIQEGHMTPVSHVMTLRDHIFVVVPKDIQQELDWRLPVFECGKHLMAFDGTALLLFEIYHMRRPCPNGFGRTT